MIRAQAFAAALLFIILPNSFAWSEEACPALSQTVQAALDSNTFMYIPINNYAQTYTQVKAAEYFKLNCGRTDLPLSEELNCDALKKCSDQGCKAPFLSHGTAFLLGDGKTLYTAWHVAEQTSEAALIMTGKYLIRQDKTIREKAYRLLKPEFVLINSGKEIVYDTRVELDTRYANFGEPTEVMIAMGQITPAKPYGAYQSSPHDFIGITLTRSIGSGMPIAVKAPQDSNCVYSQSYTYDGSVDTKSNTSGTRIANMSDFLLRDPAINEFMIKPLPMPREAFVKQSIPQILSTMLYTPKMIKDAKKEFTQKQLRLGITNVLIAQDQSLADIEAYDANTTLLSTQKIFPGGSGSPAIDSSGAVVAIITNAIFSFDKNQKPDNSYGAVGALIQPALLNGFHP